MDVTVRPCEYLKHVIKGLWTNLCAWSKDGKGKVVHGFKVSSLMYFEMIIQVQMTS